MSGLEYGGRPGTFQTEPHRLHPTHGRVTVMGRTVNKVGEWTVKGANGANWSVGEAELFTARPLPERRLGHGRGGR